MTGLALGAIVSAGEPRFKAVVLHVAGLMFQRALPEVDQINYLPRVTQPTLMLNGELDFFFPVETSQKPMFELLGTAEEDKRYRVYPGGHSVPRVGVIREALAWLDRYLGGRAVVRCCIPISTYRVGTFRSSSSNQPTTTLGGRMEASSESRSSSVRMRTGFPATSNGRPWARG